MTLKHLRRTAASTAAAFCVLLAAAGPASAHVEAQGSPGPNPRLTTITFSFSHGCTGSPTVGLRVRIPANATEVEATNPPGWTSTIADGVLSWTGGSVPDKQPASFTVNAVIPGEKGDTVYLPTVQRCTVGEETWISPDPDPEADDAAPRIILTSAVEAPPPTTASTLTLPTGVPTTVGETEQAATATPAAASSNSGAYFLAAVALLGAAATATALFIRRLKR